MILLYVISVLLGLAISMFGKRYLGQWVIGGILITVFLFIFVGYGLAMAGATHNVAQTLFLIIVYTWACYAVGLILSSFIRERFVSKKWKIAAVVFLVVMALYPFLTNNLYIVSINFKSLEYDSTKEAYRPGRSYSEINCSANGVSPMGFVFDSAGISLKMAVYDENNKMIYESELKDAVRSWTDLRNRERFVDFGVMSCKIFVMEPFSVEEYIKNIAQKYESYDELVKHKLYFKYFYDWRGKIYESEKYYIEPINAESVVASQKMIAKDWQREQFFEHFNFWMPKDFEVVLMGRFEVHSKKSGQELYMIFEGKRFAKTKEDALKEFTPIPGEFVERVQIGQSKIEADKYVKYSEVGTRNVGEDQVDYLFNFGDYWYHIAYYTAGNDMKKVFEEVISTIEKN